MSGDFEALPPGCMKCEAVTGKATCFPARCEFVAQRGVAGSKAHAIARLDQIRRGMLDPIHCPATLPNTQEGRG